MKRWGGGLMKYIKNYIDDVAVIKSDVSMQSCVSIVTHISLPIILERFLFLW